MTRQMAFHCTTGGLAAHTEITSTTIEVRYQVSGVDHYGEVSGWRTDDDYSVYQVLKGLVVYSSLDGGSNWAKNTSTW